LSSTLTANYTVDIVTQAALTLASRNTSQSNIDNEETARIAAVNSEASARSNAILNEQNTRSAAITAEQQARASDISTEVADRNNAITEPPKAVP
jgi:hypothetical protein